MASRILPEKVADAFVEQYYLILKKSPENVHKFYQESSLLGWPENDGLVIPVTTLSGINEKVMSSDYKNCDIEIVTVNAQESLEGGIIVAIAGLSTWNDNVKRHFNQTFFLAKQENGFFVLNDILQFSNASESTTSSVGNDNDKHDEAASSVLNAVLSTAADNNASNTEEAVKNENVKEALDCSISKDDAKVSVSTPSSPPREKVPSVIKPASVANLDAPKITYASMVAKVSPLTTPKVVKVSSTADNRVAPSATKASAPRVEVVPKAPAPSNAVSKPSIPPSNVAPKSPVASNGAPITYPEARGIYIGGLPFDVTKQGVAEVMKRFGPVRRSSDSIQIRRHEDGFCCGFVEFESADAARRAVQVHHAQFGDKKAYITYKRSYNRGGNDGRGRSPTRGGFQNGNFRGNENGEVSNGRRSQSGNRTSHYNGQARGGQQNGPSGQWRRE